MTEAIKPRLRWTRTIGGEDNDYICPLPAGIDRRFTETIGRIYRINAPPNQGLWLWNYQACLPGLPWADLKRSGFEPSAREAAKVIEDTWFAAIKGTRYE